MGEHVETLGWERSRGRLGETAYQLTQIYFSRTWPPQTWCPALNAYLCSGRIVICVDLAGVERESLHLEVEPRRLRLSGQRKAPEPTGSEDKALQILALEIDYGPFKREVELPAEVDPKGVTAQQRNGLLWVELPLCLPA